MGFSWLTTQMVIFPRWSVSIMDSEMENSCVFTRVGRSGLKHSTIIGNLKGSNENTMKMVSWWVHKRTKTGIWMESSCSITRAASFREKKHMSMGSGKESNYISIRMGSWKPKSFTPTTKWKETNSITWRMGRFRLFTTIHPIKPLKVLSIPA